MLIAYAKAPMQPVFLKLNNDWNAEPNAPDPHIEMDGEDILLHFEMNPFKFSEFEEGDVGTLRFVRCDRYRLGSTNDEGWYQGQCRFSGVAPAWGEFYLIEGCNTELGPTDWTILRKRDKPLNHFLFYLRDNTFECIAMTCVIEPIANNALHRIGKKLRL
jgi:hypothetical protein